MTGLAKARLVDIPELLQLIANEAENLTPLPTREALTSKILKGEVIFFLGVMIISRERPAFKFGEHKLARGTVELSHIASSTKGKGLGRKVLTSFVKVVHNPIFLNVYGDNLPALKLYKSVGFIELGRHDHRGKEVISLLRPRRIVK